MGRRFPVEHLACSRLDDGHNGQGLGWKGTVWFVVDVEKDLLHPRSRGQGCDTPAVGLRVSCTLQTGTLTMSPHKPTGIVGSYVFCKAACSPTRETIPVVPLYNSTMTGKHFQSTSYFILKTFKIKEDDFYLSPKRWKMGMGQQDRPDV